MLITCFKVKPWFHKCIYNFIYLFSKVINISKKYNYQWIAPERTGSRKVSEVLAYYDFKCTNKPLNSFGMYNYNHAIEPNEEGTDYKVICNARNPYGRVYSIFKNFFHSLKNKHFIQLLCLSQPLILANGMERERIF